MRRRSEAREEDSASREGGTEETDSVWPHARRGGRSGSGDGNPRSKRGRHSCTSRKEGRGGGERYAGAGVAATPRNERALGYRMRQS